jgi:hypothetical protein
MSGVGLIRVWVIVGCECVEQFPTPHISDHYGLSIQVTTIFWILGKSSPSGIYLIPIAFLPNVHLGTLLCEMRMGEIPILTKAKDSCHGYGKMDRTTLSL